MNFTVVDPSVPAAANQSENTESNDEEEVDEHMRLLLEGQSKAVGATARQALRYSTPSRVKSGALGNVVRTGSRDSLTSPAVATPPSAAASKFIATKEKFEQFAAELVNWQNKQACQLVRVGGDHQGVHGCENEIRGCRGWRQPRVGCGNGA